MQKTAKKWLSEEETDKLLVHVQNQSREDYLCLMLCRYGLRIGEILGRGRLPGIHVQDLRDNGIWLIGKGYSHEGEAPSLYPLPSSFAKELVDFANKNHLRKDSRLFSFGVRRMEIAIKSYAKDAGVVDSQLVGPHRLRAFFRNGPEGERIVSVPDKRHDAPQEHSDHRQVRWPGKPRLPHWHYGKPRLARFWYAGLGVLILIYHSYGILSGTYSSLEIVPYDAAIIIGVLEAIIAPFLGLWFLWRLFIWTHDHRSTIPRHLFDDPRILD